MAIVEIRDLVKRYKHLVAVDHFSLSINEGEIYGLLGPNGSGKTTVINCLLSLLRYDSGDVKIFGQPMSSSRYDLKRRIGLVMQNIGVYDELTVEENIDYFCGLYINDKHIRKTYVEDAIEFVALDQFRKFKPKELSGGLLRRLNLACGIAHKPDLIILDEPTVAVDPQSRNNILDGIKQLAAEGKTVIYTTHYMEEVELLCDRLTIMDQGKELVSGTADEIKAMSNHSEIITAEIYTLPDETMAKISELADVTKVTYDQNILTVQFHKGIDHLMNVMRILSTDQIDMMNLSVQKPTLNDVFLEITGKELRDHV
ncbi:ABC transporter ATP-binding protein [Aerococcus agrisoli]|uniref:ABC transporter ATP-binding protein n=1 Tax=Aerococcus agrisoli TaxID=2487350 RepID=A0A3N4GII9_9LACT|nr:ABC transporter ATP-binding protein [Aerococcus agrisoli]RPA58450.1 ABC transporter ATP-binding protein [Aerococcus agrisoli]